MGLCGSNRCSCAIVGGTGIDVEGAGTAADPWDVSARGWVDIDSGSEDTSSFTVTVPSGYVALQLRLNGRRTGGDGQIYVRPNGHSGSDYTGFLWGADADGTEAVIQDFTGSTTFRACEWESGVFGQSCIIDIEAAGATATTWGISSRASRVSTTSADMQIQRAEGRVVLPSSAAITSIDVVRLGSGNIDCSWRLLGLRV